MQLLWVNLVTDSLPAIALGLEPVEKDVLSRPPVRQEESLFSHGVGARIITEGLLLGAVALVTYYSAYMTYGYGVASTMTFLVLSLSQLVHAFTVRSEKPMLRAGCNPYLLLAFLVCVLLQICVVLVPMLNALFHVVPLSLLCAFVLDAPPAIVLIVLNADQYLKCIPAFIRVNSYKWVRKLTRD